MKHKGQVPLLILALAALLLVYVYFLPMSEKCKIVSMPECIKPGEKIFSVNPGIIEAEEKTVEYEVPDVELFTVSGKERNVLAESLEIRRGWLYSDSPKLSFGIHDKSKDVTIFIYLVDDKTAKVKLNGKTLTKIKGLGQHMIVIPSTQLEKSNTLELIPSIPIFPWQLNKLMVGKLIYEESYTVTQEKLTYALNVKEAMSEVDTAKLDMRIDCFYGDNNLSISFNDDELANSIICRNFTYDVSSMLKSKNNLTFFTKGNYFVYQAKLEVTLKQDTWPTYYFDLYEKRKYHQLRINFAEKGEKKLAVYINGKSRSVQTSEKIWQADITNYLSIGQNQIIIIPAETVNIESLEIY